MISRLKNSNLIVFAAVLILMLEMRVRCEATSLWGLTADNDDVIMMRMHEQWMAQYGRVYSDETEKAKRFSIFKENVEFINSFNQAAGPKTYTLGINQFADVTNQEFKSSRNGYKRRLRPKNQGVTPFRYGNVTEVPSHVDWRKEGAVTPVKNQGHCGSCWAFSAVAAMEGIIKISTGELVALSEQELVDCDRQGKNHGCQGGLMDDAFKYIIENNGLAADSDYPYVGEDGRCNRNKATSPVAKISGYEDVPANSEAKLLKAAAHQPVSVAIDAAGLTLQFYSGGVYSDSCATNLNHGVTVVGYGTVAEDGTKYWLIKNSWGETWGENGYLRLQRDVEAEQGLCGIAIEPSYPTI